ncbi:hypothetical protein [Halorubrum sp. HHNYT27]|uniref:hypothetical protein n=1 Tax=Halorubrum sp. HHNYT27 TaxID=3402275 RepID=UPI003EBF1224
MRDTVKESEWEILDPWWTTFANRTMPHGISVRNTVLNTARLAQVWRELDAWWDVYTETGHETAIAIRDLIEASNERWATGRGPFNTDPLATDVATERSLLGPLQPTNELQWSYWLAELLRVPAFAERVFGRTFSDEHIRVAREESYDRENTDGSRRADIVLRQSGIGASIEVKLLDTNYRKTAETAGLVEDDAPHLEWSHSLVLPKSQRGALVAGVDVPIEPVDCGFEYLMWDKSQPVQVIYWRDITTAARQLLRDGLIKDDQWNAAAYLFCGLVEQRLLNFQPLPVIQRMADAERVTDTTRPIQLGATLDEQLTHLKLTVDT